MKITLVSIVCFLLAISISQANEISLSCNHYKTKTYCIYDSTSGKRSKYCEEKTEFLDSKTTISLEIDLNKQLLTYQEIENIDYTTSGTIIKFYLSAPLGDTPNFFEIEHKLNKVSGEYVQNWRMDLNGRDNLYMYKDIDERGWGTSKSFFLKCKKMEKLF